MFFVLSGYLVTQVLLRDLAGPAGRVHFGRFYARRVRRLLPAAVATILVTALVFGAVAERTELDAAFDAARASLLYVANWHFIGEATNYFAPEEASPYLHFWSLAVEEQFYVAWPLVLAGLWALAGRRAAGAGRRRLVAAVVVVAGAASFAGAMALRTSAPTRAYFGTDTRAYQLLAGAALALLPGLLGRVRRLPVARLLAPAGLVVVTVASARLLAVSPFTRSAVATVGAAALILGVEAHRRGPVARVLSLRPITYLGTISYGTYLWHWPVIVVARQVGVDITATSLALLTALVATGLAAASAELLELPIRRSPRLDRRRGSIVVAGVATSVVAALVAIPPLLDVGRPRSTVASADPVERIDPELGLRARTPVPEFDRRAVFRERFGESVDCSDAPVADCTVVEGDGPHLLLIGDSNATMYVPALTEAARLTGARLSLAANDACPWQLGYVQLTEEIRAVCRSYRPDTYERLVPELQPDVIVLINSQLFAGRSPHASGEEAEALYDATQDSLDRLEATGADIVIVDPVPQREGFNPFECLATATYLEECAFVPTVFDSWLDRELRARAAASDRVHYVNWGTLVCPRLPVCDPMQGDQVVFWNENHLAAGFSRTLGRPVAESLAGLGLLPPPAPDAG